MHGLRARIAAKLLELSAGVWLNHYLEPRFDFPRAVPSGPFLHQP